MRNPIKVLYYCWRARKLRRQARNKLYEQTFNSPLRYIRTINEIDCLIDGHKWSSSFSAKSEIKKPLKERVFCKHCGIRYHEHEYVENENW